VFEKTGPAAGATGKSFAWINAFVSDPHYPGGAPAEPAGLSRSGPAPGARMCGADTSTGRAMARKRAWYAPTPPSLMGVPSRALSEGLPSWQRSARTSRRGRSAPRSIPRLTGT
jgi:hypothetical protein